MSRILYQVGPFTVRPEAFKLSKGFAVYRDGPVVALRVATIGYAGPEGLKRAIAEADRRAVDEGYTLGT